MLRAGQVIDKFELVSPIGEGGMAHVWAARQRSDHGFQRLVALKVIHSRFAEDPDFRAMFLDEAKIVAAIEHPNVVRVYDLVDTPDQLYIVMECIAGESLFGLISQYRTAPIPVALAITADACAGLHAVHSLVDALQQPRNIVHRDVSPQNILVSGKGETKLIDFGIALARDRSQKATAVGTVKGKIRYMAPEQARREEIGPWTDVFGLGATLFRAVVGKAPYTAENDLGTTQALLALAPALVPFPPNFPGPIADVIKRAIAPKVADRYRSAAEFEQALRELLARTGDRPDIAAWTNANMSEKNQSLRDNLEKLNAGVPDLAPRAEPDHTAKGTEVMKPLAPTAPDRKRGPLPGPPDAPPAAPGFMDIHALVANANNVPDLPVPAQKKQAPAKQASPAQPQAIELAFQPSNRDTAPVNTGAVRTAILVVGGVVLVFVFLFAVPFIVKSRAIATARDAGFEMTAEHVGVGTGTATFRGVKLKAITVPGVTIAIDELGVTGFSVKEMHALGMTVQLEGNPADFEMGLGLLLAQNRVRFAGTPAAPRHFTVASSHFNWKGPAGVELDAADLGLDILSRGNGNEDVKANVTRLTYKTGKTTIGPWSVSVEDNPTGNRFRVALDPAVPDGPSALLVSAPGATMSTLTINLLRSPMTNIGLKPNELGLPADGATEIETKMTGTLGADGKLALSGTTSLWGLKVAGAPKPLDLTMVLGASGTLGQPLDIDRTSTIAFGPFVAGLSGTVTAQTGSLRVDVIANAAPIPCDKLVRSESKTMGSFGAMMTALGQSVTGLKVKGNVALSCSVKYDTSDPSVTSVTWLANETCGLSIFGM